MNTEPQAATTQRRAPVRIKTSGATQQERDRIALGLLETYMDGILTGTVTCPSCQKTRKFKEPTPAETTLIRARYDKLRPSLQAVEQTITDERDKVTEDQILASVRSLIDGSPGIVEMLIKVALEADPGVVDRVKASIPPVQAAPSQICHSQPVSH